ncbi:MAG: hypothetical protein ISR91_01205 [Candidatus Delongbacteria bacterium]|nr:hypothetical protein [Candidatus Delongbacteria bacterium]
MLFNPEIDAMPIIGCDRWSSNSVERILPGLDSDNSSQDFLISFFPTPGFFGEPPAEGPELFIEISGTIAILTWNGPADAAWRIYSDTVPYFAPAPENFLAEVVNANSFYLPVSEAMRYFRVTEVLE